MKVVEIYSCGHAIDATFNARIVSNRLEAKRIKEAGGKVHKEGRCYMCQRADFRARVDAMTPEELRLALHALDHNREARATVAAVVKRRKTAEVVSY